MTTEPPAFERPVRASAWADAQSRDALQFIAEGVAEIAGFDLVGVSVVREDGYLQVLTLVGPDEARAVLLDSLAPVQPLIEQLAKAEDWGVLKFIPHDRLELDVETWGWFSDEPRAEVPGAWHPEDMLIAPLHDAGGRLVGILGMELPRDGQIPGPAQRRLLETYAGQACRAVITTLEREQLAEQVRLAGAAAAIVRRASGKMSVDHLLDECSEAVVDGFRAEGLWIQLLDVDGTADEQGLGAGNWLGNGVAHLHDGRLLKLPPELLELVAGRARSAWDAERVDLLAPGRVPAPGLDQHEVDRVLELLWGLGVESLLVVPLGAGDTCLGVLGLVREKHGAEWSESEAEAALGIGRDLGRALANARTFEREHRLAEEMTRLADYKGRLIATVSHELKNPLTTILGYLEMLEGEPQLSADARTWVAAMQRGGGRLSRVVNDLLLLAQLEGSDELPLEPVDLGPVVSSVVELTTDAATRKGLRITLSVPPEPVTVLGDAEELERVCANLVSNAVKYTLAGGQIGVSLTREGGQAVLTCTDEGIGISASDRAELFTEFFRSTNPVAVAQPGTGLGLAIVNRIVARHRGRIEVDSELGRGSTFQILLPLG